MAFAALSTVFTTGSLLAAPVTVLSLIPLLAIGINYYRYQSVDPEGRPIDAERVSFFLLRRVQYGRWTKRTIAYDLITYFP